MLTVFAIVKKLSSKYCLQIFILKFLTKSQTLLLVVLVLLFMLLKLFDVKCFLAS